MNTFLEHVHPLVIRIAEQALSHGGRAILVGGCVRDKLLGVEPKDFDIEVAGIPEGDIEGVLRATGATVLRCEGTRSFPVWKVWDETLDHGAAIDVALPRRETLVGSKHTDFVVTLDPHMSFDDAAARRDFTINAIGLDLHTGELLDPWGGREDIRARRLRHISHHFAEDPLRVLRGAQFCGRFGLRAEIATSALCSQLTPKHLPKERLWEEWKKLILKSAKPSLGLQFLSDTCWTRFFPELEALYGVQQDPVWHPEGDVWVHTLHCMDAFAETRTGDEREDLIVGFAVLCHDFGKPATAGVLNGRWTAHGHEAAGEGPTRAFLRRLTDDSAFINDVVSLVVRHMIPKSLFTLHSKGQNTDRAVRRLATEVRIDRLARVCWCDSSGRPPKPKVSPAADWIRAEAARLDALTSRPVPLVLGRDLIVRGLAPGADFGPVLRAVYEAQLDGGVVHKDDAIALALRHLADARNVKRSQ